MRTERLENGRWKAAAENGRAFVADTEEGALALAGVWAAAGSPEGETTIRTGRKAGKRRSDESEEKEGQDHGRSSSDQGGARGAAAHGGGGDAVGSR